MVTPRTADYTSGKAAVIALTKVMAKGMAEYGIRVNGIAPGGIATEASLNKSANLFADANIAQQCVKRAGQPSDLIGPLMFLASEASAYMSGQVLVVDGGKTMPGMTAAGPRARPMPARHDRPFWDGLREHRLLLPYCAGCAGYWYPPAPRCPRCLRAEVTWQEVPGRGTLYSWATACRPFAPGLGAPYTVVQVELDVQPGLLLDSTLAGRDGVLPRLGLPVTAVYLDDPRGFTVHAFTPAAGEPAPASGGAK